MLYTSAKFNTSGYSMQCCLGNFQLLPENWDEPSRSSKLSGQKTAFNTGSNNHLPARWLYITSLGEILNFQPENAIPLGNVSTSGQRIEIYLREARNILVRWLSSTLVETINLRRADLIPSASEIILTSGQRNSQHPVGECNRLWDSFNIRQEESCWV